MPAVVFGYYTDWAKYRSGKGKFTVSDVNPHLVTHIAYAFVTLNEDGSVNEPSDPEALQELVKLKVRNRELKVLVTLGGWEDSGTKGSAKYSKVAADSKKRKILIRDVVNLVDKYELDGLDLDWEYPCQYGAIKHDKENFIKLLQVLKNALGSKLLTVAIGASPWAVDTSYDVPKLNSNVDMINVMTYDFHSYEDGHVGHNAPLHPSKDGDTSCISAAITNLIAKGADSKKINLGLATYGKTYTLSKTDEIFGPDAKVSGPGKKAPYTNSPGIIGYNEVVEFCSDWYEYRNVLEEVPYKVSGNQEVAYDDPVSIKAKAQYARKMNLGGVMVWSLDTDDFHNGYPLLKAVKDAYSS